ncbi:MAG: PIN domain-containing protein [Rhodoferax sp.]
MPIPSHVIVDTNALWEIRHPDFQKIVQLSRERRFKLVVPHIVWEERRTQILDKEMEAVKSLQTAYEKVHRRSPGSMLGQLILPPLPLWGIEQMIEASKAHMVELAQSNNIEVIPLDPSHATRAWERYFDVEIPFKREEARENRRRDIPDSWIFEAAIDLYHQEDSLVALCGDGKLQRCFDSISVSVFKTAGDLVLFLEAEANDEPEPEENEAENQPSDAPSDGSALAALMDSAQTTSRHAERTILGVVGYLGIVPKANLDSIMTSIGMTESIVHNAAERLALNGLIQDTGNTYIPKNRPACELAAAEVEPLMIRLVVTP